MFSQFPIDRVCELIGYFYLLLPYIDTCHLPILMFGLNKTLKISGNQQCQKYEIVKNYFTENTTAIKKGHIFLVHEIEMFFIW